MGDMMQFPDSVDEFMEKYKIVDTEQVYTNGAELVPIFRMNQWFEHLPSAQPEHATCYLDGPCEYQNKDITLWNIYVEAARYEAAKMDERVVNAMVNGVARDCGIELDKDKLTAMAEFYKRLCMCKDCKHYHKTAVGWCMYNDGPTNDERFCSWAEPKEE